MPKLYCFLCKKKIKSIYPMPCKCNNYYCKKHKFMTDHDCSFDYVQEHKDKLEKASIKVIPQKIDII